MIFERKNTRRLSLKKYQKLESFFIKVIMSLFMGTWAQAEARVGLEGTVSMVFPVQRSSVVPHFSDDLNWQNMELALQRQLTSFNEKPSLSAGIQMDKDIYTLKDLKDSTVLFLSLVRNNLKCQTKFNNVYCNRQVNQAIAQNFNIYVPVPASTEPGYGSIETTKFTSYYSPDLEGSLTPTTLYSNPIYALPADPNLKALSREQIDFEQKLSGKNLELVWVKEDMFDIYLLQVQGGGRVRVKSGSTFKNYYLSYAGANGLPFRFISSYMVDQGYLTKDNRGVEAQRKVLEQYPSEVKNIFSSNQNYVYFKFSQDEPVGIEGIPLTEGRSAALDVRIYKTSGLINYVEAFKPVKDANGLPQPQAFSRFFLHQDTGGAIKGAARMDLYSGFGDAAAYIAYNTNYQGKQYFLVKKRSIK